MMSKKWTFSLTSLITIIALAFVVSPAMGAVLGEDFPVKIMLKGTSGDTVDANTDNNATIVITFGEPVIRINDADHTPDDPATADTDESANLERFANEEVKVTAFDKTTGGAVTVAVTDFTVPTPNPAVTMHEITLTGLTLPATSAGLLVMVKIDKGVAENADTADIFKANTSDDTLGKNAAASFTFNVVPAVTNRPSVVDIELPSVAAGEATVPITVLLSTMPKEFKKGVVKVTNADVDGEPIALSPKTVYRPDPTTPTQLAGTMVYPYLVQIKPKYEVKLDDKGTADIVITIDPFEAKAFPNPKSQKSMAYRVTVTSEVNRKVGQYGTDSAHFLKDGIIPAGGYLVVARNTADSLVRNPGDAKDTTAKIARRANAKNHTYNLIEVDLKFNLEGFLVRGGTIDLVSPSAGLVISEIMWATDAGISDMKARQWIEIHNTTASDIKLSDKENATYFTFYEANELPADMSDPAENIQDRVSTLYKGTNPWSIIGKGQSGRTDERVVQELKDKDDKPVSVGLEVVPVAQLVSMERRMAAAGTYENGTMADSWGASMAPSQNFLDGAANLFIGSPGAEPINMVPDPMPEPEPEPVTVAPVPVAMSDDIVITEIMVDTGSGRLPQWIELTNISGAEKRLDGWSVEIENTAADTDDSLVGTKVSIDLAGKSIGVYEGENGTLGKTLLLVAWAGRHSSNLEETMEAGRIFDVSKEVGEKGRYTLLSPMGFIIRLLPPQDTSVVQYGNSAGNLGAAEAWDIPMDEAGNGRSSLIRREMDGASMATMGTDANGWVLASSTALAHGPATWFGSDEDAGTPGSDFGGPLPVELSHFRPARDKQTGAVVITWSTQSELNNAGFFIKRSQQRDGQFQVINATMIPGKGTTSEKQFYTYTDTTAQPNVVYYYQIEDVSLDGNRQTLTRGIRLKGHVGAAGKATVIWGELKTSHE